MPKVYALITGASSGLGIDFAHILAERGYHLILVARRQERLEKQKTAIENRYSVEVQTIVMDLATPQAANDLYKKIKQQKFHVEILINNAGIGVYGEFSDTDWQKEASMLALNITTPTHLTKLFLPSMIKQRRGYILFVASLAAYQSTPMFALYGATKAYLRYVGEALHVELKKFNICVSVLSPGSTATEFHEQSGRKKMTPLQQQTMMLSHPVAEQGIEGLFRNKAVILPGFKNKIVSLLGRLLPRIFMSYIAYRAMKEQPDAE